MRNSSPSSSNSEETHENRGESESMHENYADDAESDTTYTESEVDSHTSARQGRIHRATARQEYSRSSRDQGGTERRPDRRPLASGPLEERLDPAPSAYHRQDPGLESGSSSWYDQQPVFAPQQQHWRPQQHARAGSQGVFLPGNYPQARASPESLYIYSPSQQHSQLQPQQYAQQQHSQQQLPPQQLHTQPQHSQPQPQTQQQQRWVAPYLPQLVGSGTYYPEHGYVDRSWGGHQRSDSQRWQHMQGDTSPADRPFERLGGYESQPPSQPSQPPSQAPYGTSSSQASSSQASGSRANFDRPHGPQHASMGSTGMGAEYSGPSRSASRSASVSTLEPLVHQRTTSDLADLPLYSQEIVNQFPSLIGQPRIPSDNLGQLQNQDVAQADGRVSTALWEEEGTICLVVSLNGMSVTRRCDNNMINGTKLLNSANISRGRRDGVLKGERVRNVVKIGGMDFKGVWIPFERALEMARRENVLDELYPLFVADLNHILYARENLSRLRQMLAKGSRRNQRFSEWFHGIPHMNPIESAALLQPAPQRTAQQYQIPGSSAQYSGHTTSRIPQGYRFPPQDQPQHASQRPSSKAQQRHRRSQSSDLRGSDAPSRSQVNIENYTRSLRQVHRRRQSRSRDMSSYQYPGHFRPEQPEGDDEPQDPNKDANM